MPDWEARYMLMNEAAFALIDALAELHPPEHDHHLPEELLRAIGRCSLLNDAFTDDRPEETQDTQIPIPAPFLEE